MRKVSLWLLIVLTLTLSACKPASPLCDEGSIQYRSSDELIALGTSGVGIDGSGDSAQELEINGRIVQFDQVIHGPLCNNHLAGTVYIACDIEIADWKDKPNFLDGCDFEVSPGSVVYVAAHKNAAYYQGCDFCHVSHATAAP